MSEGQNVHGGHRERTINKFLKYPESFCDHELVELLLFYALPRVDTNPLAHRLIDAFGGINKLFKASTKELMTIEGVGEKVATFINLISKLMDTISKKTSVDKTLMSPNFIREDIIGSFKNFTEEKIILFMLDDKFKLKEKMVISSGDKSSVSVDALKLGEALVVVKPKHALIAHNHPSGIVLPSQKDDAMTERVGIICAAHGVALVDHFIVSGDDAFSYFSDGRLDDIKKKTGIEKMLKE